MTVNATNVKNADGIYKTKTTLGGDDMSHQEKCSQKEVMKMEINKKIRTDLGVSWYNQNNGKYMIKYKNRIMPLHKAVYLRTHGEIPEGHTIHHLDGNRFNNKVNNLIAIPHEQHVEIHKNWKPSYDLEITHKNLREVPKQKLCKYTEKSLMEEFIGYDEVTLFGVTMKLR